jgi:nitrilase
MVVDPWGAILAESPSRPGVCSATIDPAHLKRLRQQFPVLEHRRIKTVS